MEKQSLDAYLFLRFFKMIILICGVGVGLTWPILFPINITGGGKGEQLDRLTIGNVRDPNLYYAHMVVAVVFLTFVMFTITRETLYYINLRQAYLLTPWNASRISSKTVLFTSIPERQLDEGYLRSVLESVKRVWIVQDHTAIKNAVDKRMSCARKLERAIVEAVVHHVKDHHSDYPNPDADDRMHGRPTVRTTPLVGQEHDAISRYTAALVKADAKVELERASAEQGNVKPAGGAFVEFATISAAQYAVQSTAHQAPFVMIPRSWAVVPSAVVWENISIPAWETVLRGILGTSFIVALVIFWSIPTSFIGILSNVSQLADDVKWLHWLKNLPDPVIGAIEGLLPSLLLSTLVSYVPVICRYVAYLSGEVTKSHIELKTQEWYFIFQVIQVFLVTTFASGATAVIPDLINDPKEAPVLLARKLPKASNFYLSYFIIYGFGQSTKNLLNWSGLFMDKFFSLFDKTPRDKYERYVFLGGTGWGSWYPKFTNLAIIGTSFPFPSPLISYPLDCKTNKRETAISYSTIAPLTLGFATVAFSTLYLVFRYNLFYVLSTSIDTQGRAYAKALQQLTVGIYTTEFCLIGLFSISVRRHGASAGPLVCMVVFTVLTIVYHRIMHKELNGLTKTLPVNIVRERESSIANAEDGEGDTLLNKTTPSPPAGLRGLFTRFFEVQKYASFDANLSRLHATKLAEPVPAMSEEKEESAYSHPAMSANVPTVWVAADKLGRSKELLAELPEQVKGTDEGAWVDEKGKVHIDRDDLKGLPVWKEKVYY